MEGSLLILVVNEEHMHHVVNLTKAAWERGMRVFVLFSGRGVNLIRDPDFRILEDKATVSICEASFRDYGLADQPDAVPASAAACLATLSSHAELMAQVDRHVVF